MLAQRAHKAVLNWLRDSGRVSSARSGRARPTSSRYPVYWLCFLALEHLKWRLSTKYFVDRQDWSRQWMGPSTVTRPASPFVPTPFFSFLTFLFSLVSSLSPPPLLSLSPLSDMGMPRRLVQILEARSSERPMPTQLRRNTPYIVCRSSLLMQSIKISSHRYTLRILMCMQCRQTHLLGPQPRCQLDLSLHHLRQ